MRTHYGLWQPCWISNQHQKHKSCIWPSSEHFWQVWLISVQRFQRRRFKCEKLTDGRTMDAYPWQKLTWPMARWAKNHHSMGTVGDLKVWKCFYVSSLAKHFNRFTSDLCTIYTAVAQYISQVWKQIFFQ